MKGKVGLRWRSMLPGDLGSAFSVAFVTVPLSGRDELEVIAAARGMVGKPWGVPGTHAACSRVFASADPGDLVDVLEV